MGILTRSKRRRLRRRRNIPDALLRHVFEFAVDEWNEYGHIICVSKDFHRNAEKMRIFSLIHINDRGESWPPEPPPGVVSRVANVCVDGTNFRMFRALSNGPTRLAHHNRTLGVADSRVADFGS